MIEELELLSNPKSRVVEAVKTVRTNLEFSAADSKNTKIMLTSTMPGEGKSFITACLAQSYATTGKKVLIIDCDMRRGRQYEIFGVSNNKGLSNILISDLDGVKIETIKTKLKGVYLLPGGTVPPNPSELLESKKMQDVITLLEKDYDILLFDCPPVIGLSDSLVVTKYVDTTVVVSTYKTTPTDMLKKSIKSLEAVNAKIAGVIFNKVPTSMKGYYSKYYDGYYE
ncbi:MAG: CpsD/CapB family tyrosine-protein kinase [Erysipelotrichales bacterium]|nr:CpsD/CapB family tyrosine-protein kinase [Erysipelotrichales bacterium]